MIGLKIIKGLIKALHSNISPRQIAAGAALGAMIGLMPFFALHIIIIFILIFLLQVNIGAAFVSIAVFGIVGAILDPVSNLIGYGLLVKAQFLTPLWTSLYNTPIVPYTRFNNTVVLGSFVISLLLFIPIMIGTERFVLHYRERYRERVEKWGIVRWFKLTSIYSIFDRYK